MLALAWTVGSTKINSQICLKCDKNILSVCTLAVQLWLRSSPRDDSPAARAASQAAQVKRAPATVSLRQIDALVLAQPCLWLYLKLMRVTLAHLPRVRGACSVDGVDPQLVGDVSQPLQGFLVGFVVARHGFWSLSSQSFTLEKLIQVVWVTQLLRGVGW